MMDRVIVRFKRPSSKVQSLPSESLNLALTSLVDTDEFQPLLCEATAVGRRLALDVYQDRTGRPFLINIKQEEL